MKVIARIATIAMVNLLIIMLCISGSVKASETSTQIEKPELFSCGDAIYCLNEDGTATITEYLSDEEEVQLPETVDGHIVTNIGAYPFDKCKKMRSLEIPDSVMYIESGALSYCNSLEKIIVSPRNEYLAVIDGVLFSKPDKKLIIYPRLLPGDKYEIPYGIEVIGDRAFSFCFNLNSVEIPDTVTSIGDHAFSNCSNLSKVGILGNVTDIGKWAFAECGNLIDITIPDGLISIGDYAFYKCPMIGSIVIPDGATHIGYGAFLGCSDLSSITIPDSMISIGKGSKRNGLVSEENAEGNAFEGCDNLSVIVSRGSYAEEYCIEYNLDYSYIDALDWLTN